MLVRPPHTRESPLEPSDTEHSRPSRRRRSRIVGLAVALPASEALLLLLMGWDAGLVLAPQITALGPIAAFHDLRWLLVVADSPEKLTVALLSVVAFRALFMAAMVHWLWPTDAVPRFGRLFASTLGAQIVSLVLFAPSAGLLFGVAVAAFSWPVLVAFPAAYLVAALMAHGFGGVQWWRGAPPAPLVGWLTVSGLALSLAALVIQRLPTALAPVVAAAAGFVNAQAWSHSGSCIAHWEPRSRHPLGALAIAGSLLGAFIVVAAGFAIAATPSNSRSPAGSAPERGDTAVLLVAGFESECCGEAESYQRLTADGVFESFSYAGLDSRGRPLPHTGAATRQDLAFLGELMARQVGELFERTGRRVDIVAESEGTLVVQAYLMSRDAPEVRRVMLLSPIRVSGLVSYPEPDSNGAGYAGGELLRALARLVEMASPFEADADGPLARSILQLGADPTNAFAGVDVVAIVPLADALSSQLPSRQEFNTVVVPAFHGGLRGRDDVKSMIAAWLDGHQFVGASSTRLVAELFADGFAAWRVPGVWK